ncbi:MAG: AAA family ATPase [Candidatus Heimdallarchaeota archaeon]|nr:AAA family ATPase [Candidatus Heimdallarchaeota archaeon]
MSPNIFEKKPRENVFREKHKLMPEYVPEELPCRDKEQDQLVENLRILLDPTSRIAVNISITGKPGVGKTTIAKKTITDLKSAAIKNKVNLDVFYINCHSFRTKTSILRRIATDKFRIQGRGFSDEELIEMLATRLEKEDLKLVLAIDEAGMLKGNEILSFIHLNELFPPGTGRLSTIIICRRSEWSLLLSATLSGRIQDQLNLEDYSKEQLKEILTYRKGLSFFADVISDEIMELIVEISSRTSNARHGIEIMLRAGMKANAMGSSEINADFIRAAKTEVYPELRSDVFLDLKRSELFAALALGRILEQPGNITTTINQSYDTFASVAEEYGIKPPSKASFRLCIDTLEKLGIISHAVGVIDEGRGRRAKISLYDIPAQILVERVENVIKHAYNN